MKFSKGPTWVYFFIFQLFLFASIVSCDILDSWMLSEIENKHEFEYKLSNYNLLKGDFSQLKPNDGVVEFKLTTPLYTDYATKQRLIRLPEGKSVEVSSVGEFSYPDSTMIAKTFYYPQYSNADERRNHIIETRLLYLLDGIWNVAVYEWNRDQTEAFLIKDGTNRDVEWVKKDGSTLSVRYRIPSLAECTTCHQSNDKVEPIGPKLANMDHSVLVNNEKVNQLDYLHSIEVISNFNREDIDPFPRWNDFTQPLEKRARAYMDVNCAHCHTPSGFANYTSLYFDYELPLSKTGITSRESSINDRINSRWRGEKMPLIGTTIIHKEGVELIQEYLESI